MTDSTSFVWVFSPFGKTYPSAVFSSEKRAREWIEKHMCKGTLTEYPVDISAYDYAVAVGDFRPKIDRHRSDEFVSSFSNATGRHFHFDMDDE